MQSVTISKERLIQNLLLLALVFLLAGRAWQFMFWDMPLREWLWSEQYSKSVITWICGCSWESYLSSPVYDQRIQYTIKSMGVLLAVCTLILAIKSIPDLYKKTACWVSFTILTVLTICLFKENFFRWGYMIELSAQWFMPLLFLYLVLKKNFNYQMLALKLIMALTFIGHGLYAMGYYPVPGIFVDMTISGLHVNEDQALVLLKIAGYLDFIVAIGLFLPVAFLPSVFYMAGWGLLTTFARVYTQTSIGGLFWETFHQWAFETLIRNVHFILPVVIFLISYSNDVVKVKLPFFAKTKLTVN